MFCLCSRNPYTASLCCFCDWIQVLFATLKPFSLVFWLGRMCVYIQMISNYVLDSSKWNEKNCFYFSDPMHGHFLYYLLVCCDPLCVWGLSSFVNEIIYVWDMFGAKLYAFEVSLISCNQNYWLFFCWCYISYI